MAYKTSDFRKGLKVQIDGEPYVMSDMEFYKPGKGNALYKCKLKNLVRGTTLSRTYKGGDTLEEADVLDTDAQFLYKQGDLYVFMNKENYEQYELKAEQIENRGLPKGFIQADHDPVTGKTVGWLPVDLESKEDKWHAEAWANASEALPDGTYELIGPKVQGNPEGAEGHYLEAHGGLVMPAPVRFDELREWLKTQNIEGVVWKHPDGRMAKIKKKDFGLPRASTEVEQ